jgi:hypothetical protein
MRTLPEPARDIEAQVRAMLHPASSKDAVFLAPGTPEPQQRGVWHRVERPEGVLLTTNAAKAGVFRGVKELTDHALALLLDYPESKTDVLRAGGIPTVVQAVAPDGGIVYEAAASDGKQSRAILEAWDQLRGIGGSVRITTLADALEARAEAYADGA